MSDEISDTFDHPESRAKATQSDAISDRISLRDHIVDVEIGAFQAERDMTQRISFNIVVELVAWDGPVEDDVDRILSYDRVTEAIDHELAAERLNLLETLAERVADRILLEPQAARVFVRIEKLDRGAGKLGVEIVRTSDMRDCPSEPGNCPKPRIAFLSDNRMSAGKLAVMIDHLTDADMPLILCVDLPTVQPERVKNETSQRRIDLLAIEQNAWCIAALDARCVVVGSKTELDWAMKNGQISVWAPSKIVLDAVDAPPVETSDGLGLAMWFARQMQAAELVTLGVAPPKSGDIPTRQIASP